jgi:hypothetical protein
VTADGGDGLTGSVSVGVWQMACKRVIRVGERVVKDLASTFQVSRNNLVFILIHILISGSSHSVPESESDGVAYESTSDRKES